MEINTKAYGRVKINPDDIITFDGGLLGFREMKTFVLLGDPETTEGLVWLQSLEEEHLAFVVIQPRFLRQDYQPEIHIRELEELEIEDPAILLLYAIVTIPEDFKKMTVNLRAPVVINVKNNTAKQVVLNDDQYRVKEPFLVQLG